MLILIFIVVIAIGGVYFLYNSNDIKTVNKNFSVESFDQIKVADCKIKLNTFEK